MVLYVLALQLTPRVQIQIEKLKLTTDIHTYLIWQRFCNRTTVQVLSQIAHETMNFNRT